VIDARRIYLVSFRVATVQLHVTTPTGTIRKPLVTFRHVPRRVPNLSYLLDLVFSQTLMRTSIRHRLHSSGSRSPMVFIVWRWWQMKPDRIGISDWMNVLNTHSGIWLWAKRTKCHTVQRNIPVKQIHVLQKIEEINLTPFFSVFCLSQSIRKNKSRKLNLFSWSFRLGLPAHIPEGWHFVCLSLP
jgi:hypothetical protein